MSRLAFLFRTDTHVWDRSPESWKGDYPSETWSNLEQVGQLALKHDVAAVLDGGDFFHVKAASKNPHALVARAAQVHRSYPCSTYCIEGNHDIQYNNLDSVDLQPLGVLYAAGVFQHLREQVFTDGSLRVRVVGVPYSPTRSLDDLRAIQKQPGDTFLIAVVHALAGKNPPAQVEDFFHEPVFRYENLATPGGPDVWCFPPNTPVLDWLYRPIPISRVGETLAVSGRSGPTSVEVVHPTRHVSEDLVRLDLEGVPSLVPGATVEHPYWVAKGLQCNLPSRAGRRCHPDKLRTSAPCASCTKAPEVEPAWVKAGEIEAGDYVALPVPSIPTSALSEPGLARLLGYYVAEGHIIKNRQRQPKAGVAWSFHEGEVDLHEDVRALVREHFGLEVFLHRTTGSCIQVCAYGQEIAEFFSEHGGQYAEGKALSSWIWQRSAVDRLEFLVGWMLGDGYARSTRTEIAGVTVSQTLAYQVFFLALSLGLRPFFTVHPPKTSTWVSEEGISKEIVGRYPCHVLSFYGDGGAMLAKRLEVTPPDRTKTRVSGFFADGLYYVRVREVSRWYYEGPVHNFRTGTGEYVAGGVLVHNCFGHWHRDQGIEVVGGKYFVNQGALSRGSLIRENLERTPKVALVEFTDSNLLVQGIPLSVLPASEVFDLERKEQQEAERKDLDQFVSRLVTGSDINPNETIQENIRGLSSFAKKVQDKALYYFELAEAD